MRVGRCRAYYSGIAQLVEHLTVNQGVDGSSPPTGVNGPLVKWLRHRPFTAVTWVQIPYGSSNAGLAQLVEHRYRKPRVTGSSPATGTPNSRSF